MCKKYEPMKKKITWFPLPNCKMQSLWCKGFYTSQCKMTRMHEHRHICEKPKWKALRTSISEIQYQVVAKGEGIEVETWVGITIWKVDTKRGVRIN